MVLGKLPVRGVLQIWIIAGQGPTALAVGAAGGCLDIFTLAYHFYFLSPSLWETTRYRLKYCLKGPLCPKTSNQPRLFWIDLDLFYAKVKFGHIRFAWAKMKIMYDLETIAAIGLKFDSGIEINENEVE